jgi:hypothetical protein
MEPAATPGDKPELEQGPHFVEELASGEQQAWEEIGAGRYMPRRTRGSCKGRALG